MSLTFHYDQSCKLSSYAAKACGELGIKLQARAYSPSYGGVFIDRELNDTDVAIIVPEHRVQWSGRHVMTTRRRLSDDAIPPWARKFQNFLVLNPVHETSLHSCTFLYAVSEGVKTLHTRKSVVLPNEFDEQLRDWRIQANDSVRWSMRKKHKPKRRLSSYGILY